MSSAAARESTVRQLTAPPPCAATFPTSGASAGAAAGSDGPIASGTWLGATVAWTLNVTRPIRSATSVPSTPTTTAASPPGAPPARFGGEPSAISTFVDFIAR